MTIRPYSLALSDSSRLKLRATAILAEGGSASRFEAAVLFHDAARAERRALASLDAPPPPTRLAAVIEQCWCLLAGFDPLGGALAWGEVLEQATLVDAGSSSAMISRVRRRFREERDRFVRELTRASALDDAIRSRTLPLGVALRREAVLRDVDRLLGEFPGMPWLWWAKYRVADARGGHPLAWQSLERARRLDPEHWAYQALAISLAPKLGDDIRAAEFLESSFARIVQGDSSPEVCLQYALVVLQTSRPADEEVLRRARRAVDEGLRRPPLREWVRHYLEAVRFLIEALASGHSVTDELLYRAGLGALAVRVAQGGRSRVLELLREGARDEIEAVPARQTATLPT